MSMGGVLFEIAFFVGIQELAWRKWRALWLMACTIPCLMVVLVGIPACSDQVG